MGDRLLPLGGAHWVDDVARHALMAPTAAAIRFDGRTLTWGDLHDRSRRLGGALAARGIRPGDRVAILMTNRPEFVESVIAVNGIGAIAVPINFRLVPAEVDHLLDDSGAGALLTDPALLPLASTVTASRTIPVVCAGPTGDDGRAEAYDDLLAEAAEPPDVAIADDDVALLLYTSGTTGRPKGAMLTHLNLLMQVFSAVRSARLLRDDDVALWNVPLFHIAGVAGIRPALLFGTTTVIMPTGAFSAEATLEAIEAEAVTSVFLVPAQWEALCSHPDATRRTASLRAVSWGAAPASRHLLERMSATFPDAAITSVFGQTEMSPVTTYLPPEDAVRKIGSVGRPLPTVAVRIVDDDLRDVAPGEVGEIVYRAPTLMAGYWNNEAATDEACEGGWFHSGDLVRADDEGYLYVVDRKKDMIVSGGENIYCAEVEDAIAGHPKVVEVAVVGAPHPDWGETPVAVVVPAEAGDPPDVGDLTGWLADRLASYKKPTQVVIVEALPRNAAGKVLKHELRSSVGGRPPA